MPSTLLLAVSYLSLQDIWIPNIQQLLGSWQQNKTKKKRKRGEEVGERKVDGRKKRADSVR